MAPSLTPARTVHGRPVFTSVVCVKLLASWRHCCNSRTTSAVRMKTTRTMYFKFSCITSSHPESTDGEDSYSSSVYFAIIGSQQSPTEQCMSCSLLTTSHNVMTNNTAEKSFLPHLTMKHISKTEVSGQISYIILDAFLK
jgi:hypothetical protein